MKKILFQAAISITLFFAIWFGLSKIDWMTILKIEQVTESTEKKLGDLFWDLYADSENEIKSDNITKSLDSILNKICISNNIDKSQIKLHVIKSDEVNAFALPNKHLVIHSALIIASGTEAELSGVISHEIAHMELNHVMKKLVKEIGLSVLISMSTGNAGSEKIKETIKLLSSSAYDRNLEKEADMKAVEYLKKSNIDPEDFANFLNRLGDTEETSMKYFTWISTHPDSKERSKDIIESIGKIIKTTHLILKADTWKQMKEFLTENQAVANSLR